MDARRRRSQSADHLTRNGLSATLGHRGRNDAPFAARRFRASRSSLSALFAPLFSYVPKDGDESTHPEWFGASLVERIRSATPAQEIGFHSFSHVPFAQRGMTQERAIAEYRYCSQIANELGIPETTFIFPRNLVAYLPS